MRCTRASTRSWRACATPRRHRLRARPGFRRAGACSTLSAATVIAGNADSDEEAGQEKRREETHRQLRLRSERGFQRLSKSREGKIAGAAPADLRHGEGHQGRRHAGGSPEMGAAELSHDREQERQHHPDRPGEGGSRPVRGLFPLPDRSGRDFSRALSGTALWRQPQHSARRRREAARGCAAPLRRAGADVSCEEAEGGTAAESAICRRCPRKSYALSLTPPAPRLPASSSCLASSTGSRSPHWAARG